VKILYLITRTDPLGGAHIHVRDLCQTLLEQGHAAIVCSGGTGAFAQQLKKSGIPHQNLAHLVRNLNPWRDVAATREIVSAIRRQKPDLISTHNSKAGVLGRIAASSLGLPVMFTAHGWSFATGVPFVQRTFYRAAERTVGHLASLIVAVSQQDRRLALQLGIAPPNRIVTIHNGVKEIRPELRADPRGTPPTLVMVARFDRQKAPEQLVEALHPLTTIPWRLQFVGEGPNRIGIEAMVREKGMASRIEFLGEREDVAAILGRAQALILATHWEGFPRSILEAMRAGLPVLSSDVGGVSEAVIHGQTGFLVPANDVETMRRRLEELILNPDLRESMGAAGRRRYEQAFTFERLATRTISLYRDLARPTSARRPKDLTSPAGIRPPEGS
jgi:glycosyltransferase involved in cell wall biosynthesis